MAIDQEKVNAIVTAADSRYVRQVAGKGLSTEDFTTAEKTKLAGLANTVVDATLDDDSTNPVQNKIVKGALDLKADSADLATVATTGSYDDLTDVPALSDLGGIVTVEKQTTAETGYAATYVVKQDSSQVGAKINIPKDFLVKSGEVKTATAADLATLGSGYTAGDKYIDFVINSKDDDDTDAHMYINVKDLVEDTTYTADETTLTLSNGEFAVKSAGIDTAQIKDSAVTTAKIAAKNVTTAKIDDKAVTAAQIADSTITATQIATSLSSTWLTTSDVEDTVEDYLTAITTALGQ